MISTQFDVLLDNLVRHKHAVTDITGMTGYMVWKGEITADFDSTTITGLASGWVYTINKTGGVTDTATSVHYNDRDEIAWNGSAFVVLDSNVNVDNAYIPVWDSTTNSFINSYLYNESNKIGFKTTTLTHDFNFNGDADISLGMVERTTSGNGYRFMFYAGNAKTGSTDANGGNFEWYSGLPTGTGTSGHKWYYGSSSISTIGSIVTITIAAGGTNYSLDNVRTINPVPTAGGLDYIPTDILAIIEGGATDATVEVDTVGPLGEVLTCHLVDGGISGYTVGAGKVTSAGGIGTGCTIEITAVGDVVTLNQLPTGPNDATALVTGVIGGAITTATIISGGTNAYVNGGTVSATVPTTSRGASATFTISSVDSSTVPGSYVLGTYLDGYGRFLCAGITSGVAFLETKGNGTTTAGFRIQSAALLTGGYIVDGNFEYYSDTLYFTVATSTRKAIRDMILTSTNAALSPISSIHELIEFTSATNISQELPTAVGYEKQYTLCNTNTGIVTITCAGAETISGMSSIQLRQYESVTIRSNNSNWIIVAYV